MLQIESINESNYDLALQFIKSVPSITNISNEILNNAVLVNEDGRIVATIDYEEYDHVGLIRYFVFKKNLSIIVLEQLINKIIENAKAKGLNKLVSIADGDNVEELFKNLSFFELKKIVYCNEERLSNSFSYSKFLCKNI